jgi:hemolysin III
MCAGIGVYRSSMVTDRAEPSPPATVKPRLRGVLHQYAFVVALLAGAVLVLLSPTLRAQLACGVYAVALAGLFGVSALYHRVDWPPTARRWMRRLDHAMIFLLIAGTYTPIALLVLPESFSPIVLGVVWVAALVGIGWQFVGGDTPKWTRALAYVALGWVAVWTLPEVTRQLGLGAIALLVAGGALYTLGAVIYTLRRPDPVPAVFGYHELFHALIIPAAMAHFAVVAWFVLPRA